jgi:hypothetical protein
MFLSIYLAVIDTIVNSQIPYLYIIANLIAKTVYLKRHVYVGIIHEYNVDKSYFVTNITNALTAVIVRAMLGLLYVPIAKTSCYMAMT